MSFRVTFIAGATANDEFRSSMALSEFDGLFIDPENLRDPDAALLARRRKEVEILLSSGGVIVIFARPRVEIGTGVDNYSWLLHRPFDLVERRGVSVRPLSRENPFREYFDVFGGPDAGMFFQVVLENIAPDLGGRRVLAENKAGEPIGILYRELNGTIAMLPPIREIDDRFRSIIREVTRRLREQRSSIELAPAWVRSLPPLPGESEHLAAIKELETQMDEIARGRDERVAALEDLRSLRALLWETGTLGLEPAARRAFRILGFTVEEKESAEGRPGASIRMRDGDGAVLCEVDTSDELVELEGFRRLHEAVTESLLEKGVEAKGILLGNGNRLKPVGPGDDRETFATSGLNGCAKFGYAAVPAYRLYRAVEAVLRDPGNEEVRARIRRSILEAGGEWKLPSVGAE